MWPHCVLWGAAKGAQGPWEGGRDPICLGSREPGQELCPGQGVTTASSGDPPRTPQGAPFSAATSSRPLTSAGGWPLLCMVGGIVGRKEQVHAQGPSLPTGTRQSVPWRYLKPGSREAQLQAVG